MLILLLIHLSLTPYSSAWVQSYGYDVAGRLASISSPAGNFEYLLGGGSPASDLIKKLTLPNGAYITNSYDNVARLAGTFLKNSANQPLHSHEYLVNQGNQRDKQTFAGGNYSDYTYDDIGQLVAAIGKENGGANRFHEQAGYQYDAAGNLLARTNYQLVQTFGVDGLNQLSNVTRSGYVTVAGFTTTNASVTVDGGTASVYQDRTFSRSTLSLADGANTFTAVATDALGRSDTNSVTAYLPATVSFQYDPNGNLTSDGLRLFHYDDENQLTRVCGSNWMSEFVYDGFGRRRIRREFGNPQAQGTLVTSVTPSATLRNDFSGWVGFRFTVGSAPLVITELGRWVVSGNSASHALRIVGIDGIDVPGATTTVNTSGATAGQFIYGALATPVGFGAEHGLLYAQPGGSRWRPMV